MTTATELSSELMVGTVQTIFRYPIKSVGGTTVDRAYVGMDGVLGDRRFAFLDLESGNLCNAKNPRKFGSLLACRATYVEEPVPREELPPLEVVFPDGTTARSDRGDLDQAMSRYLGRPVRLISSVPEGTKSEIVWLESSGMAKESVYAESEKDEHGDHVASYAQKGGHTFFDLAPLHFLSTSTIEHFRRLNPAGSFDARRYRPTMLLDTPAAGLVEEAWVDDEVRIGERLVAKVTMLAPRCVMTTLEHATDLPLDRGTLRTIVKNNTKEVPGRGKWACAGVYSTVAVEGRIEVGDAVRHRLS